MSKGIILKLFNVQDEIAKLNASPELIIEDISKKWGDKIYSETSDKRKTDMKCQFFETADDVPDPEDLDANKNNLMIFDDLQLTKQNKCENYYIRGRHSNVDCFYLAQNYFLLPRKTIRENTNFICLFPQDDKNVDHIYRHHVSSGMKKEEFKKFCKHCWSQPRGFAVIDLSSKKDYGKYRSGFDNFYIPDS